jgi:signal transduction histidine kinase
MELGELAFVAGKQRSTTQELQRQYHLFSEEYCFSRILNALPLIIIVLNQNRELVYCNKALLNLLSLDSVDTILGKKVGESLNCVHNLESKKGCGSTEFCRCCELLNSVNSIRQGKIRSTDAILRAILNGNEETFEFRAEVNTFRQKDEDFILLSLVDVSAEKRRLFLEGVFLHDLANTASSLSMLSDMVDSCTRDNRETMAAARRINSLSRKMMLEIKSHKQLVAAEYNQLELKLEQVDSIDFITKIHSIYRDGPAGKGIVLQVDLDTQPIVFETDQTLLGRVLGNMIKNGLEASQQDEIVTVGCYRHENRICFWVHNNGCMGEDTRLKIFNRSFSTKGKGRGLGTYSMKYFTEKYLQGTISFQTDEINGTRFVASYPLTLSDLKT